MNDQRAIARQHFCADIRNSVVDRAIGGIRTFSIRRTWTAQDHAACVVVGLSRCDVGLRQNEAANGFGLGIRERPVARAALHVIGLPIGGEVAVHVVAAGAIFVDFPVAVVVNPFHASHRPITAANRAIGARFRRDRLHHVWVEFAASMRAVWIGPPHHADRPVAIEVVRAVFVERTVAVVVGRLHACTR